MESSLVMNLWQEQSLSSVEKERTGTRENCVEEHHLGTQGPSYSSYSSMNFPIITPEHTFYSTLEGPCSKWVARNDKLLASGGMNPKLQSMPYTRQAEL